MLEAVNSDQQIERGAITHFARQCSLGRPTVPPLDFSRISNVFLESGWHWYMPGVSISLAAVFSLTSDDDMKVRNETAWRPRGKTL